MTFVVCVLIVLAHGGRQIVVSAANDAGVAVVSRIVFTPSQHGPFERRPHMFGLLLKLEVERRVQIITLLHDKTERAVDSAA